MAILSLTLLVFGQETNSAKQKETSSIRIASWSAPIAEQINLLASEHGLFAKHHLAVQFIPSDGGAAAIENILAGKADIAFTDPGSLFSALARGEKLLALYDIYPQNVYNLVSLKSSNIQSPQDLKGKKIGVYSLTSATKKNLLILLRQARLTADDVEIIETGPLNFIPLILGQVDATAATDTGLAVSQALGLGEVDVIEIKDYFNYSSDVFVVTEDTYQQQKEQLDSFLTAYKASVRWMMANPEQAAQLAVKYASDGEHSERNAIIIKLRNASSLPQSGEPSALGLIDFANLQHAADMYYELGMTSRPLDLGSVVHPQYRLAERE